MPEDTWIVVVGSLCAIACALPGCFLVLRKMSMMGDAISHAVLPGLALAFMISGSRSSMAMFIGAAVVGVLTAVFTHWISNFGKVDRGASMGIVFTTLFALGLLLIVQAADKVDLDAGCVLYGSIETTPYDVSLTLNAGANRIQIPRAALVLSVIAGLNLLVVTLCFKELKISSFDPQLASTLGIHAGVMHYLLMIMVAVTTVASFEVVGSIIVIAMLIVPAATASLLTRRLLPMLVVSVIFGLLAAITGHLSAILVPRWFGYSSTNTSGMMAVCAGLLFILVWMLAPGQGLLSRMRRQKENAPSTHS